jgi:hypothetical protein
LTIESTCIRAPDLRVVRGALVGVLSVRQVEDLLERPHVQVGNSSCFSGEPPRDRSVVAGGERERLPRQVLPRCQRQPPVALAQLLEHGVVALGPHDDGRERMVLRRRADHRRPADIDVLDTSGSSTPAPRRRALERIEVHAHEVDELDPVLSAACEVRGSSRRQSSPRTAWDGAS